MGKGQRNKATNKAVAAETETKKKPLKEWQIREKRKTRNKVIAIVLAVAIVAVAGVLIFKSYRDELRASSGDSLREVTALSSDHFSVNNAMFTYFFMNNLNTEMGTYGQIYQQYYGLDTNKSFKEQNYSDGVTWYQHFLDGAVSRVKSVLYTAEAAYAAGAIDEAAVNEKVDDSVSSLNKTVEEQNTTVDEYLAANFGKGIKEQDIRDALRLAFIASSYSESLQDALNYSDEEIESHFNENASDYTFCDYISYTFKAELEEDSATTTTTAASDETSDSALDQATQEAYDKAKQEAEKLAGNKDDDSFRAALTEIITKAHENDETAKTEGEIAELVEEQVHTDYSKKETGDIAEWCFDEARAVGDTTVIDDGEGSYTAVFMLRTAYRHEYVTKDVRHMLFKTSSYSSAEEAEKAAEEALAEWEKGDKTEDSFAALAKEKSEDSGSAAIGGLYENVALGTMVEPFENWIYDESRAAGDTGIVESSYGYHVMYFVGDGEIAWKAEVRDTMVNAAMADYDKEFSDTYKVNYDSTLIAISEE